MIHITLHDYIYIHIRMDKEGIKWNETYEKKQRQANTWNRHNNKTNTTQKNILEYLDIKLQSGLLSSDNFFGINGKLHPIWLIRQKVTGTNARTNSSSQIWIKYFFLVIDSYGKNGRFHNRETHPVKVEFIFLDLIQTLSS